MKLLRLDLIAFGPFTRQRLSLADGDEGLHIVYGPNEAGKTSTLRALRCLLYGFPHSTGDGFLHPYKDLRVGALLRARDGATLECIRRKGIKNTLRSADDADIIDESRLAHFLSGITEEAFRRQFGIDHAQLVAGGQEIVAGGGEIGQILFAAASGFAQLNDVRRRLGEEADSLFTPAATVKPINKALADLKERRQAAKEAQLSSVQWKSHRETLAAAEERKRQLEQERLELSAELARLERIQRALPDIARRSETREELERLRDVPCLSADFGDRRRNAERQAREAELKAEEASQTLGELTEAIEGLDVCEAILARKEFIERLRNTLAIHQKAEEDSRALTRERDRLLREAADILKELGRGDLDLRGAGELRITREERLRIQRLGADYTGLVERVEQAQRRLNDLRTAVEQSDEELHALPPTRDAAPLARALKRLQMQGDLTSRCAALEQELKRAKKQAQVDVKKLTLWQGSLEELEALPLPSQETIAAFEERWEAAGNECEKLAEQHADARRQADDLNEKLRQLDLQHDVPTEEHLAAARRRRDEGWRQIRAALRGGEAPEVAERFLTDCPGAESLEEAYEMCVQHADEVADRLRREAERVGEKSQLLAQHARLQKRWEELAGDLEQAQRRRDQCRTEWIQQWRPTGIEPLSPREMRAWANRHANLVEAAEAIRRHADEAANVYAQINRHRRELLECLAGLDVYPEWTDPPLDDLAAMCEATLEEAEQTDARRAHLERDAARQRREIEAAADELRQARDALGQWRTEWTEATRRLRLQPDAEPSVAGEVLNEIDELFAKIREAEGLTERIEAIASEAQHFAQNVTNVCEGAAPDLVGVPYGKATTELHQRLEAAKKASVRLADLQKQRTSVQKRREAAQQQLVGAKAELDALCKEAGCESPEQLLSLEEQANRQRALRRRLEEIENRLHQEAAGKPLEKFIEEAQAEHADQLPAATARLRQRLDETAAELGRVNQTIGEERKELEKMDGNARAAAAQEEAEQLLAQLRDDADRYVRLRLAAEVLHGAIQRHRQKNQGPVLQRASVLFRDLTLGSFAGLKVDYNEAGAPLLVGVRDGGQTVAVEGMSDGSCDQLYLALRLASLEHYLDSHAPLPFIVDDILITFDDDRAAAALRALAYLSRRTQVIFFTHHGRLVELARKLPKNVVYIHQLPSPLDPEANGNEQEETRERSLFA